MTQQEIQRACNAMFTGVAFRMISSRCFEIVVRDKRMFVDGNAIAKVCGNALYVTVLCNRNETTVNLLNALPNVRIERRDDGMYCLNGVAWSGGWSRVVDDLYKHEDDL